MRADEVAADHIAVTLGMCGNGTDAHSSELGSLAVDALLACIPDARYGVTVRPDGTVEAAMPPKPDSLSDEAKGIKYAAEKAMEPTLRQWFTIAAARGWAWPDHDAENAAVDLSWELEKYGLLTTARPLPAAPDEGREESDDG